MVFSENQGALGHEVVFYQLFVDQTNQQQQITKRTQNENK